ncbi:MAG: hypothetical protein ABII00_13635 [Elusimicrobiota bacterium]
MRPGIDVDLTVQEAFMTYSKRMIAALAVVCLAAYASAESIEELKSSAGEALLRADIAAVEIEIAEGEEIPGRAVESRPLPCAAETDTPRCQRMGPLFYFEDPTIEILSPDKGVGPLLGSFRLEDQLNAHRDAFNLQFGAGMWDFSLAADAGFDYQYFSFQQGDTIKLHRIEDPKQLRGEGVVVRIDDRTSYRFKVSINIFNPVRGSSLLMDPVNGTQGPDHRIRTGTLLDRVKEESYVFNADRKEFWTLYGNDVDPATDTFADTRSLLFVNENGMGSKGWPLAETALEPGTPLMLTLGETKIILIKTLDGQLRIHAPVGTQSES